MVEISWDFSDMRVRFVSACVCEVGRLLLSFKNKFLH